jgi:hypothetical protein
MRRALALILFIFALPVWSADTSVNRRHFLVGVGASLFVATKPLPNLGLNKFRLQIAPDGAVIIGPADATMTYHSAGVQQITRQFTFFATNEDAMAISNNVATVIRSPAFRSTLPKFVNREAVATEVDLVESREFEKRLWAAARQLFADTKKPASECDNFLKVGDSADPPEPKALDAPDPHENFQKPEND